MPKDVVEGETANQDFILTADGVAFVLIGGDAVTLILKTQDGRPIDTAGNVSVVSAGLGKVRYTPDAGDFRVKDSPYLARFKVVRGLEVMFFPNGAEDPWTVHTP